MFLNAFHIETHSIFKTNNFIDEKIEVQRVKIAQGHTDHKFWKQNINSAIALHIEAYASFNYV